MLLKIKVRELFLAQNVLDLDQEVGMMKKQKEVYTHVRMLIREIRKSLDKQTILYTTLVELSKTLNLQNCAVWMPNEDRSFMNLIHGLSPSSAVEYHRSLPIDDLQDSVLAVASSGVPVEPCTVVETKNSLLQQAKENAVKASQARNLFQKVPYLVMGDEKRAFQVILHTVGHLLDIKSGGGSVVFKVILESGTDVANDKILGSRRHNLFDEYVTINFEIKVSLEGSQTDSSSSTSHVGGRSEMVLLLEETSIFVSQIRRLVHSPIFQSDAP
ncbi:putative serine/threonine-protein phosphatase PP1-like isoform 1 [Capsicum annuum]|nr:putative serine/threonine-protein phosphatase PP1-like isoform 1 [Capsicum annuum]